MYSKPLCDAYYNAAKKSSKRLRYIAWISDYAEPCQVEGLQVEGLMAQDKQANLCNALLTNNA